MTARQIRSSTRGCIRVLRSAGRSTVRHRMAGLLLAALTLVGPFVAAGQDATSQRAWVSTWGASPSTPGRLGQTGTTFEDQTLRQIVHTSVGGDQVRVRLSNRHGSGPLVIGEAHIALRSEGAGIVAASDRTLTFSTAASVTVPPGALVLSDPVDLEVPPLGDLAVSLYFPGVDSPGDSSPGDNSPGDIGSPTSHGLANQTSYISSGNLTASAAMPEVETTRSWFFLTAVEVWPSRPTGVVVTLGDSITDGYLSTPDANNRWPDYLARRLAQRGSGTLAVVNAGISGNRILHDLGGFGVNALARFDADVLVQAGVTHLVVLEGINDIGIARMTSGEEVSAEEIIAGHRQLIARAHARGLKIYGATLTPFEGAAYFSPEGEVKRMAVNEWIRTSGAYDAVIDFDAATRDPGQPSRFRPDFSQDSLHPNDAGYEAMAASIDLALFD